MEIIDTLRIRQSKYTRLQDIDLESIEFGQHMSDHMFRSIWKNCGWSAAEILPYGDLVLSPVTLALHYGQSIFEGMKAFRLADGSVSIFRIEKHHERLNRSLRRMCMPEVPFDLFHTALTSLVSLDRDWVPASEGSALYLRPFVFASEGRLGVKVSDEYQFLIVTGPVPPLYPKPIRVKVEREYIRAARGGTGYAKCAGNYGGAFYPTQKARAEGFDQVIWTDATKHEYVEESGTMNLMFVIDGTLVTPPLSDSILDGVTRDSLLQLARDLDIPAEERPVGIREIIRSLEKGRLTEAFGAGTAAVVAPIAAIGIDEAVYTLPQANSSSIAFRLRQELHLLRTGQKPDRHKWNTCLRNKG